jgi:hypothetical protein
MNMAAIVQCISHNRWKIEGRYGEGFDWVFFLRRRSEAKPNHLDFPHCPATSMTQRASLSASNCLQVNGTNMDLSTIW